MTYEEMKYKASDEGLDVREFYIPGYKGRIKDTRIAIHEGIEYYPERSCVLAEEIGHYHTTVGDINGKSDHDALRQEYIARAYAYEMMVGLSGLVRAYRRVCRTYHEVAEELGVTAEFLQDALEYYEMKYGSDPVEIDGYLLRFSPRLTITPVPERPSMAESSPTPVVDPSKVDSVPIPEQSHSRTPKAHRLPKRTFSALDLSLLKHQPEIARILGLRLDDIPKKPNRFGMAIKQYKEMREDIADTAKRQKRRYY